MTATEQFEQVRELCTWWSKRANTQIRLARLAGTAHEPALLEELAHCNAQVERLRADPRYRPLYDPGLAATNHAACDTELELLRVQNMQLRVKKNDLWEQNSDLKHELGKLRKTRHDLPGPRKGKGGRPVKSSTPGYQIQVARLSAALGVQGVKFDPLRYAISIRRPAWDKLMAMLQEALDKEELAMAERSVSR